MTYAEDTRPLLFLDVDGPVNVFKGYPHSQMRGEAVCCAFTGFQPTVLHLDARHPAILAELAEVFRIVWATAWEHAANEVVSPLVGLPVDTPVVEWGDDKFTGRAGPQHGRVHWKTVRLAEYAAGRPFMWLDDECDADDQDWFDENGIAGYAVTVDPHIGITSRLLDWVLLYAAGMRGE